MLTCKKIRIVATEFFVLGMTADQLVNPRPNASSPVPDCIGTKFVAGLDTSDLRFQFAELWFPLAKLFKRDGKILLSDKCSWCPMRNRIEKNRVRKSSG
jgi:hypothetical protein